MDTVVGIVVDVVNGKPLPGASVTLTDSPGEKKLKTVLTDEAGKFTFLEVPQTHLLVIIEHIGYEQKRLEIHTNAERDIGLVQLFPLASQLTNVTVTATRPLVRQEIDRITYDVQSDPENKAQSVLDMLRKVPLISIDGEDNIRLKGSGSYRILINGRPSSLVARDPREAFKAMPAGSIQRIEIITTPPAKYDGEGLAGIINIITIKKSGDGYFASLGIRYNSVNSIAENASATSRIGRIAITGSGNLYQNFQRTTSIAYTRNAHAVSQLLDQRGNSTYKGTFSNAKLELSYDVDSLSVITLSLGLFGNNNTVDVLQRSQLFSGSAMLEGYSLSNKGKNRSGGFDMDVNYQAGFRRNKDQLLTLSYNQVYFPNQNNNQINIDDRINYMPPDFNQSNDNGTRENTVQVDFTKPVGKTVFDLGGKMILRNSYSDFVTQVYDNAIQEYARDTAQSNRFSYSQDVYSFYSSSYWKIMTAEVRAGIRLEHTEVNANFETQKNIVRQSYTHFIPSVSLRHSLSGKESLVFGFTQRIYRPGIWMLNPFVNKANPRIVSSGNPGLKAVLNNNFELIYTRAGKGSFSIGLSYLFANNMVQTITMIQDTVSYSMTQNAGKYQNLQLNTSLNQSFSSNVTLSLNGQVSYINSKGIYKGNGIKNDGIEANITANFAYKISETWRFSFNNGFIGPYILLQGRTNSVYTSSFNLTKLLFDKKLVLAAVLSNPYQKFRYAKTYIETPDFSQLNDLQRNYRSINISATWNLGNLKSTPKKTNRKIVNDDTRQ
ncbi:MAG: outer membrane beta-barrel protein [Chitinophagaceae bacterium]|nr:outer membrane beta-barrel protein [Chitinophagaceae bacterium]